MTKQFTIELSDAEFKALSHVAVDVNEWIQNAVHFRCSTAIDDIVNLEVQRKLSNNEPITGTKEDIVNAANIESAADRQDRLEEEYRKLQEEQQG